MTALPTARPIPLTARSFELAEGPLWDPDRRTLFFVDIPAGEVFALRDPSLEPKAIYSGAPVGGITLQRDGALLLFRDTDVATLNPVNGHVETLVELDLPDTDRCNDVFTLPSGAVLFGTIGTEPTSGGLHRLATDGSVTTLFTDTKIPNGMALSNDLATLYYTDSTARTIHAFPFDRETEAIGARRSVHVSSTDTPDGLAIDDEGLLYSARWGGSRVLLLDGAGVVQGELPLPTENVTSLTIAGPDDRTLFITTAGGPLYHTTGATTAAPDSRSAIRPR